MPHHNRICTRLSTPAAHFHNNGSVLYLNPAATRAMKFERCGPCYITYSASFNELIIRRELPDDKDDTDEYFRAWARCKDTPNVTYIALSRAKRYFKIPNDGVFPADGVFDVDVDEASGVAYIDLNPPQYPTWEKEKRSENITYCDKGYKDGKCVIRVEPSLREILERAARAERRTKSIIVRDAIAQYIQNEHPHIYYDAKYWQDEEDEDEDEDEDKDEDEDEYEDEEDV